MLLVGLHELPPEVEVRSGQQREMVVASELVQVERRAGSGHEVMAERDDDCLC